MSAFRNWKTKRLFLIDWEGFSERAGRILIRTDKIKQSHSITFALLQKKKKKQTVESQQTKFGICMFTVYVLFFMPCFPNVQMETPVSSLLHPQSKSLKALALPAKIGRQTSHCLSILFLKLCKRCLCRPTDTCAESQEVSETRGGSLNSRQRRLICKEPKKDL